MNKTPNIIDRLLAHPKVRVSRTGSWLDAEVNTPSDTRSVADAYRAQLMADTDAAIARNRREMSSRRPGQPTYGPWSHDFGCKCASCR